MPVWTEAIRRLQQLKLDIGKITGNEMVNYALDNIRKEIDIHGRPMTRRKAGSVRDAGRGMLVNRGIGRRSIQVERSNINETVLTANEYMIAHNDGVNETVNVSAHSRRGRAVRSHSRHMNLPQRQFTGKSDEQTERIEKVIAGRMVKALT